MFKVYGAGKMAGLSPAEAAKWRKDAARLFRQTVKFLNPCDYYSLDKTYTAREAKVFDLALVRASNLVLVDLDHPDSIGTAIELQVAQDCKIPVVGFGTAKNHPWIELNVDKRFDTLAEAVNYIIIFYVGALN